MQDWIESPPVLLLVIIRRVLEGASTADEAETFHVGVGGRGDEREGQLELLPVSFRPDGLVIDVWSCRDLVDC